MKSLRKIAFLNGGSAGLDYIVKILVTFFINPYFLFFLGEMVFGIWKVLGQLNSYMATGDLRAATSLKWIISKDRSTKSGTELARIFSTALFSFLLISPIYIISGGIIIYISPFVTKTPSNMVFEVRLTTFILVITFVITQFFFLYESLLQAMNLAYKRLGLKASITIVIGIGSFYIMKFGYGILEIAIIQLLAVILNGFIIYYISKKYVEWYKIIKVNWKEIKDFTGLSLKYLVQKFADMSNTMVDMILLSYFAGPIFVAQYTFSLFAMLSINGIVQIISTSIIPGVGKFYGEGDFKKLFEIRQRLIQLKIFLLIIGGSSICLLNESFVHIWTGEKNQFVGNLETLIIVIIAFIRNIGLVDTSIVNITLKINRKILNSFISTFLIFVTSYFLVSEYKVLGLLISLTLGALVGLILNTIIINNIFKNYNCYKDLFYSKLVIFSLFSYGIMTIISKYITINSWLMLILCSLFLIIGLTFIVFYKGLNNSDRKWFLDSIKSLKNG